MMPRELKKHLLRAANLLGADVWFRRINRGKLLVVMYHGVTTSVYGPVWTQLPVDLFKRQLEFLRDKYALISLSEVVGALRNKNRLPDRAALITFDDGLQNNYTVAFPVLRELGVPAAVYLTVDYIGTPEILWVDELYLLLSQAALRGADPELTDGVAQRHFHAGRTWACYQVLVESLKRLGSAQRVEEMNRLRSLQPAGLPACHHDFRLLNWDEVRVMHRSRLVEFGVHTATHRILSELGEGEWEREIVSPKDRLERELGTEAATFCFPNGRPGIDFGPEHLDYLRKVGYVCAFTTENALFDPKGGDPMSIGRVPAGNDGTSQYDYFRLNISGAIQIVKTATKITLA